MKKWAVGILSSALMLGAGTNNSREGNSFEKMLSFMQEMHPDSSKEDLQEMYNACHNNEGMMDGANQKGMNSEDMMNRF